MAQSSAKDAAARAREKLLNERIPAVENLAAAHADVAKIDERIARAQEERDEAVRTIRERYDEARTAGWSARELRDLGYPPPRSNNAQRGNRKPSRDTNTTQDTTATNTTTNTAADAADNTANVTTTTGDTTSDDSLQGGSA